MGPVSPPRSSDGEATENEATEDTATGDAATTVAARTTVQHTTNGGNVDDLTNSTVELLQTMIRNACVNDGTATSGHEERNADLLVQYLSGSGVDIEHYDAAPGRRSMVARIAGSDPSAPSLCLMGHTDVVPVNPDGWSRDPFGVNSSTAKCGDAALSTC